MGELLKAIKALKLWQIFVFVAVLLGAASATYGGYVLVSGPDQIGLAENQQIIPVQYGDLVNQVSTNGNLVFPIRETMTFGSQGIVDEVLVEEGQEVEQGQELARIDQVTVASLEKAVAQARVNLRISEDAFFEANNPQTSLEMAQAELAVANSRLSLSHAQESLQSLLQPSSADIAQAELAVADSRLSLSHAQESLRSLLQPSSEDIAQAELAVTESRLSVDNARETLEKMKDGPTEEDIAEARVEVDSAKISLANAQGDLKLIRREWDEKIQIALDILEAGSEGYELVFSKWLGVELIEEELDLNPSTILHLWGAGLDSLFHSDLRFQDGSLGPYSEGPPEENLTTPWSEVVIYTWLNFYPGSIMPTCEDAAPSRGELCIQHEMEAAWENYQTGKEDLDGVQVQSAKSISSAELSVIFAVDQLASAQQWLVEVKERPDPLEIDRKEKQLALALAVLDGSEENLSNIVKGGDPLEVEAKQKQLAVSHAILEEAMESLVDILGEPAHLELDLKLQQMAVAQASVVEAEADLEELKSGVDFLEVADREADLTSAKLALNTALENLEGAVLRSPIDGIITFVNVEEGQSVNPNTPVAEVADPTVVELDAIVDEIDVMLISEGARADVILDALPGQVVDGTVSSIGSAAQNQQGVVSYPIRVRLQLPNAAGFLEGLSATASIVIHEERDVLLLPVQAIYGTFEQPIVRVMNNGSIEERVVVLGNSDDFWTVVREGVVEGDRVVLDVVQASTDPFAQFRQLRQAGGGAGFPVRVPFPQGGGTRP